MRGGDGAAPPGRKGVAVRIRGFGELETAVMDRIWVRGADDPVSVREVFEDLAAERSIAYTTVLSTMDNLHTKGWLTRERDGKAYRYRATLTREQHGARLMRQAFDGGGGNEAVLQHFVEQITPAESERLRAVLRRLDGAAQ